MDVQLNQGLGDAAQLRAAMEDADIVPLLLVHLGGDEAMLDEAHLTSTAPGILCTRCRRGCRRGYAIVWPRCCCITMPPAAR